MSRILAYTSPALGHLLPMSALLLELASRGHTIHLRTFTPGLTIGQRLGFSTDAIDSRIEAIEHDDWKAKSPPAALKRAFDVFGHRAQLEVNDLADAIERVQPDGLLIDMMCWGALSAAEAGSIPWAAFAPTTPLLRADGMPPYGPGLKPLPVLPGRVRDAVVRKIVSRPVNSALPPINRTRDALRLPRVGSLDGFFRQAPLMLVASAKPFEYPNTDWGAAVEMIGPCALDPESEVEANSLAEIDRPIVLVTTSSEKQDDEALVRTAIEALADEPVHVVATIPAGRANDIRVTPNSTVFKLLPHGEVLDRAVCAVTHGGMGATQKALAHGVPVCVVPFGRDQFEVARRVEIAECGTRLPAKKLSPQRLRRHVHKAMAMTDGAKRVAAGFAATGGTSRGAEIFEQQVLHAAGGG